MTPRLSLRSITKRYGAVVANDCVSLDAMPGEIVALLGENGAGKSTLMKIAYGATQPDLGTISIDGTTVTFESPRVARAAGIAMVLQQFAVFETLTALENVALGLPAAPLQTIESQLRQLGQRYALEIDPSRRVHDLSVGERQRIEILRALMSAPRVLILDEPTSVLTPQAVDRLLDTLRQLAGDGVSIVFISHKLHEVRQLADRCVVLRAGRVVADVDPRAHTEAALAQLMLGVDSVAIAKRESRARDVILQVRKLSVPSNDLHHQLHDVSFDVSSGEIVGIAGISGNGQNALMSVLAGERVVEPEALRLFGQPIGHLGSAGRRALGLRYIPEQRLGHAAVGEMSLASNAMLTETILQTDWLVNGAKAREHAAQVINRFDVQVSSTAQNADTLSGGNLQKYIAGREILHAPRVLVVHQPTWGVDIGAAMTIRNELIALRAAGCALIVVSEEIDELYQLADRLFVMSNGRLSPPRTPQQIDTAELGQWMAGRWPRTVTEQPVAEPAP